jgi:hypothetical protein
MIDVIISAIWQWILGRFGASTDEKLGRAEVESENLKAEVKAEKEALDVQNQIGGMPDAAVDDQLRRRWW